MSDAPSPCKNLPLDPRSAVVVHRHRVEMAAEREAEGPTKFGPSNNVVADASDLEVIERSELGLEPIGDRTFLEADRGHVDQISGQV